jgi:hypothetical protein
MKHFKFYIILLVTIIAGCVNKKSGSTDGGFLDGKCTWLKHDEGLLTNLFKNTYAKSISDSFIYSLYINNYKTKIKAEGDNKDSISILKLQIVPHLVITPRGDSDVYDVSYAFTDQGCSRYYDSVLKSNSSMVYALRFSLSERKVICYLSNGTPFLDSNFMDIKKKVKQPDFINIIKNNQAEINDKLISFLKDIE